MSDFYVMCAPSTFVVGTLVGILSPSVIQVSFGFQKVDHVAVYSKEEEEYTDLDVVIWVPQEARDVRCMFSLPSPFNNKLRFGTTLLFQVPQGVDFVLLWNTACAKSVTWKHIRPKKVNDPLQKLGLPPRLHEHLRDQLLARGLDAPLLSDDEQNLLDSNGGGIREDHPLSSEFDTSDCNSSVDDGIQKEDDDEESYYTSMDEDVEEEEEVEEEELDEPDYNDD